MEQAYFSEIRNKIIPFLNEATDKIQVAMAWFTSSELFGALLDALNRNVDVELVLLDNAINYMDYAPDFNELIKLGGKLRIAGADIGFMHHKFCVIDDKIAITGSYNWTYYVETRNVENIIISDNPEIAAFRKKGNLVTFLKSYGHKSRTYPVGFLSGLSKRGFSPYTVHLFAEECVAFVLRAVLLDKLDKSDSFCHF